MSLAKNLLIAGSALAFAANIYTKRTAAESMADKKDEKGPAVDKAAPASAPSPTLEVKIAKVDAKDQRAVIFYYPTMQGLADSLVTAHPERFRKGAIKWDYFPDTWPNIQFEDPSRLENRHVIFIGSLTDRRVLFEQLSMILVLPRQFVQSLTIVFPWFGPATMERVDAEGVLATAETMSKIISSCIPITKSGPATLRIFDIHALPIRFYFVDNVVMRLQTCVPLLLKAIPPGTTLAFPDEGAAKRFKRLLPANVPIIVCAKVRLGDKRVITVNDRVNWPADDSKAYDNIVIIDDLVQTGGTLHECRLALVNSCKAKNVSAYCTHGIFPNDGHLKFMEGGAYFGMHKFYLTNTVPEVINKLRGKAPFEILDISPILAGDIIASLNL